MPPPDFGFVFLVGVGGVRNQDVGIAAEIGQFLFVVREVELASFLEHLIVGDVADGAAIVVNSIAETFTGVAEEFGFYANTVDLEAFLFKVAKIDPRAKFAQGDGEVDPVHLR